jgi:hypothetical protein
MSLAATSLRCRTPAPTQLATGAAAPSSESARRVSRSGFRGLAAETLSTTRCESAAAVAAGCAGEDEDDDENDALEQIDNSDGDADDADHLHGESSSVKARPAKQFARTRIQIVAKVQRVKGFKSPKIAQYNTKHKKDRRWDKVARKYVYPCQDKMAAVASDQPPPPPRSHKKSASASRSAPSPLVVAPASCVALPSETRSCSERAGRASARVLGMTPKVIVFEDRESPAVIEATAAVANAVPVAASASAAALAAVPAASSKADKWPKKHMAPSARAVGVMPKIIQFDGDDERDAREHQLEDSRAPAIFANANQHPQTALSFPNNTESARPKPVSSSTPHKRARSSAASPLAPAPIASPRKRGLLPSIPVTTALAANISFQSFGEEIRHIVTTEMAADPRSEAKLKAVAQFLLSGVVERTELADKCACCCRVCAVCSTFADAFFVNQFAGT